MCAWGITENGQRALVSVRLWMRETKEDWIELGRDLSCRGLQAPRVVVADGAPGLTIAIEEIWPRADRQHYRDGWIGAHGNLYRTRSPRNRAGEQRGRLRLSEGETVGRICGGPAGSDTDNSFRMIKRTETNRSLVPSSRDNSETTTGGRPRRAGRGRSSNRPPARAERIALTVSFRTDVLPSFTSMDIEHMNHAGVSLDDVHEPT